MFCVREMGYFRQGHIDTTCSPLAAARELSGRHSRVSCVRASDAAIVRRQDRRRLTNATWF
jgi:hypothetical protein